MWWFLGLVLVLGLVATGSAEVPRGMRRALPFLLGLLLLAPGWVQMAAAQESESTVETEAAPATPAPAQESESTVETEATPAPPQTPSTLNRPLQEYRENALHHNLGFMGSYELHRNGESVGLGVFFGGGYQTIFAGSPRALKSMRTYRHLKVGGTIVYALGLGMMIYAVTTEAPKVLLSPVFSLFGADLRPETGGLLGGLIVSLIGTLVMGASFGYLDDATDQYNQDLYLRLQR